MWTTAKKQTSRLLFVLALLALAACRPVKPVESTTFLLRSNDLNVQEASSHVIHILASQLEASGALEPRFPVTGNLATAPDPSEPSIELLQCMPGEPVDPDQPACLLLNQDGDFIRVLPITWQSQAFYMYRIYVLPRSLFARVDLSKDFVAVDPFLFQEPGLSDGVAQAIYNTTDELGARPFQP